jgi:histone acetyltransferase (RNA polymerase elongator complex component)
VANNLIKNNMKTQDKIEILNLIIKQINKNGQHKLNVLTFLDLEQLLKKSIDELNSELIENHKKTIKGISDLHKCTCLRPQPNCFSGLCTYCNKIIKKNITTDDL